MIIDTPAWDLRRDRYPCPCCGSELGLKCCPSCGWLLLVCGEVATVLFDPHSLTLDASSTLDDPLCLCPKCKSVHVAGFRNATSDEILAAGFQPADYE